MTKHQHETISKDHANGVTSPNGDYEIERSLRPLIEIGWIMAGALDELDREAIEEAQQDAKDWLCRTFSEFEWKMPMVWRDEANHALRVEPVQLLDYGVTECNLRHWDFTLIVTAADLVSHYKSNALSVVSRSLQAGVISTARIGPYADQYENTAKGRILLLASRLRALTIHLIGHLAGLEHEDDPESFMAGFETVECLDSAKYLGPGQTEQLRAGLQEVADQRLEEKADVQQAWTLRFYLQAAWINRRQIAEAVVQANPWQFPFRLSRLTTGAASAMLILMVTAEAWELGLSQSGLVLSGVGRRGDYADDSLRHCPPAALRAPRRLAPQ